MSHSLNELQNLNGKTALVTGGAGYLGMAMCEVLAELGSNIIIASRNLDKVETAREKLKIKFPDIEVHSLQLDLLDDTSIKNLFHNINSLDILINNAWSGKKNSFESISNDDWEYDINLSLNSVFKMIKHAKPLLKKNKGVILNVSSMYGHIAPDYRLYNNDNYVNPPSYGAAKAGVIQFTKYLASFLAPEGIRVNCISPGAFPHKETQQDHEFMERLGSKNPLNRIGYPDELKGVVALLCTNASSYMTGQNICVDGGWGIW
ncbi:3-oxoacyl-[acyl-carrier-protein] reductase FabG [Paraliobacillus ryukyuensis]|uniref:Gluconate 5-dehydrogenase n=1 Tax=Paraliobacillus ryukyuensis TaxID=200904 RepID=A0A366EEC6_9BACI|nr:SDR family oxidoreductase [Paraliobacillus ryukyuensis]RBP00742.1 gluconate 5-dehydrogenase [Paraliobacillus ryukyuensis]